MATPEMNEIEKRTIQCLHTYLLEEIQTQWLSDELFSQGIIDDRQLRYYQKSKNPTQRARDLLRYVPRHCTMDVFLSSLEEIGRDDLCEKIKEKIEELSRLPMAVRQNKAHYGHSFVNYSKMAQELQTRVYKADPNLANLTPTINLLTSLPREQSLSNNLVAFIETQLGMDRIYKTKSQPLYESTLFCDLNRIMGETSFPDLAAMVYESNYAEALARSGRLHEAIPYAERSLQRMDQDYPCRHNVNCIYALVNIHFQLYIENKDPHLKQRIIDRIHDGYSQLEQEDEETKRFWRRMLLVKEVFCLLGIDLSSGDISGVDISDEDLRNSRRCLDEVKSKHWQGMEPRRRMLYYRAEVKYHVCKNKMSIALTHTKKALKIASEKEFHVEKLVIQNILEDLTGNTLLPPDDTASACNDSNDVNESTSLNKSTFSSSIPNTVSEKQYVIAHPTD